MRALGKVRHHSAKVTPVIDRAESAYPLRHERGHATEILYQEFLNLLGISRRTLIRKLKSYRGSERMNARAPVDLSHIDLSQNETRIAA
jgi:hypothetical protein